MKESDNLPKVFQDDSIDLIALLRQLYLGRILIAKMTMAAAVLGVVIALSTPNTYTSGVTFIPQTGTSKSPSSFSGLASLAGLNFSGNMGGDYIPSTLYPEIINSVSFRKRLLNEKITFQNKKIRISEYLTSNNSQGFSLTATLKKYTLGLPRLLINSLRAPEDINTVVQETNFYQMNKEDQTLFNILESNLDFSIKPNEGFLTIEFSDKDRFIAAEITNHSKDLLQEYIIKFKNQAALELLSLTSRQYEENRLIYERLQDSLAIFIDKNQNITSRLYQNKLDRLERELNLVSTLNLQLASEVQQAKLKVNSDTPVFTIIDPVSIPLERSKPNRSQIVVVWTFLGLIFATGYVLVRGAFNRIIAIIIKGEA